MESTKLKSTKIKDFLDRPVHPNFSVLWALALDMELNKPEESILKAYYRHMSRVVADQHYGTANARLVIPRASNVPTQTQVNQAWQFVQARGAWTTAINWHRDNRAETHTFNPFASALDGAVDTIKALEPLGDDVLTPQRKHRASKGAIPSTKDLYHQR
ncbi:hypothetical protein MMC34_008425 [Xylographa carneopallida]|nr:hypothetical protein [Xylographa carneopallida]